MPRRKSPLQASVSGRFGVQFIAPKDGKFMKVSSIAAALTALSALSLPACYNSHAEEHGEHHEQHRIVATRPLIKDITVTQQYVCQIHSRMNTEICARAFGILEEINVREGQAVKAGDVLFRVNPRLYQAKYDAEAAEFRVAEQEYLNTKRLAETAVNGGGAIVSEREVTIYKAKMEKAKANMEKAEVELNFATVKAPFDGVIDRQEKQQGSTVKEGEILTTLSDNSSMWVYFNVPEARDLEFRSELDAGGHGDGMAGDAGLVGHLNRTAKFELVLANSSKYPQPGKVSALGAKVNNETGNRKYRADFPNPARVLCHGRTGNVLVSRTLPKVLVIPQRATFEVLDRRYVFVVGPDDVARQREITVQQEMDDNFVIGKGLDVTDRIVLEGVRQVREGQKVEAEFRSPEEAVSAPKHVAE